MGSSYSTGVTDSDVEGGNAALMELYAGGDCGVTGGAVGGMALAKGYKDSPFEKSKARIITGIGMAMNKVMGTKFDEKSDPADVLARIADKLPTPGSGKGRVRNDKQEDYCNYLVKAINNVYGKTIIGSETPTEERCDRVAEIIYSLSVGMHSEFLTVLHDVSNVLKNLKVLRKFIETNRAELIDRLKASDDQALRLEASRVGEVHKAVDDEITRQVTLLENLLNTGKKEFEGDYLKYIAENKEFESMIKKYKGAPGTGAFGDKLAYTTFGLKNLAGLASRLNTALKTVGMTVNEFEEGTKNVRKLYQDLTDKLTEEPRGSDQFEKYLGALSLLTSVSALSNVDDIVAAAKERSKTGGSCGSCPMCNGAGKFAGGDCTACGGATGGASAMSKGLGKHVKREKRVQDTLVNDFGIKFRRHWRDIFDNIEQLVKIMGSKVQLTPGLEAFVRAFGDLESVKTDHIDKTKFAEAMIGYSKSTQAKQYRDRFVSVLNALAQRAGDLVSGPGGDYFRDIQRSINAVNDEIRKYEAVVIGVRKVPDLHAKKDGGAKKSKKKSKSKRGGDEADDSITDAEADGYLLEADDAVDDGTSPLANFDGEDMTSPGLNDDGVLSLQDQFQQMHFGRNAIDGTYATDLPGDDVLGGAVGGALEDVKLAYGDISKAADVINYAFRLAKVRTNLTYVGDELESYNENYDTCLAYAIAELRNNNNDAVKLKLDAIKLLPENTDAEKDKKANLKEYVETQQKDTDNFYKAIESVEKYLQLFTDAVSKNYENIKDLGSFLESSRINRKWYTSKSGDTLKAYIEKMEAAGADVDVTTKGSFKKLYDEAQKLFDYNQALKNVLSYVAYIGKKFGDKDIYDNLPMKFDTMLKVLNKFIASRTIKTDTDETAANLVGATNFALCDTGDVTDAKNNNDFTLYAGALKAMCAKVFTVVGTYAMFRRPTTYQATNSALRTILGGSFVDIPVIHEDAIELYTRLPLLLEFYRDFFKTLKDDSAPETEIIALVPEFENVWKELVYLFFVDLKTVSIGSYSDVDTRKIINEINKVYSKYKAKYPSDTVNKVIYGLVDEVNRRYGVVLRSDYEDYVSKRDTVGTFNQPAGDGDVIDEEQFPDESPIGNNVSLAVNPSDRFVKYVSSPENASEGCVWKPEHRAMVWRLRNKLKEYFGGVNYAPVGSQVGTPTVIRTLQHEVRSTRADSERYELVRRAMRTVSTGGAVGGKDKRLMAHETLHIGIDVLNNIMNNVSYYCQAPTNGIDAFKNIIGLCTDLGGLCVVRPEGTNISFDFSELVRTVVDTLNFLRSVVNKLRSDIDSTQINGYLTMLNNIQTTLVDRYFSHKDADGSDLPDTDWSLRTFEKKMNDFVSGANVNAATILGALAGIAAGTPANLNQVLATDNTTGATQPAAGAAPNVGEIGGPGGSVMTGADGQGLVTDDLIRMYNNTIAMYVAQFIDGSSTRIYDKLIDRFVNGTAADAIFNGNQNDTLYGGMAQYFRTIYSTTKRSGSGVIKHYLENNFAEIPKRMKENMKANLPVFIRQLKYIVNTVDVLVGMKGANKVTSGANFDTTVQELKSGATALLQGATDVLKELEDSPRFFETYEGSIEAYRANNNREPFMPLSTAFTTLKEAIAPRQHLGSPEFAVLYGTRGLVSGNQKTVTFDDVPTMRIIVDMYNANSTQSNKVDKSEVQSFMTNIVSLLKYAVDNKTYKPFAVAIPFNVLNVAMPFAGLNLYSCDLIIQCGTDISNIVQFTESPYQKEQIDKFIGMIDLNGAPPGRHGEDSNTEVLARNIIDMNIVPLNVHALVREMPLAYLMNYEYTYEHMVSDNALRMIPPGNNVADVTKDVRSNAIYPFMYIDNAEINRLCSGDGTNLLTMQKPKFLHDQLYTKVLEDGTQNGRFDYLITRSFVFSVNLQRMMRKIIYERLFAASGNVVSSYPAIKTSITEDVIESGVIGLKSDIVSTQADLADTQTRVQTLETRRRQAQPAERAALAASQQAQVRAQSDAAQIQAQLDAARLLLRAQVRAAPPAAPRAAQPQQPVPRGP